MEIRWLVKIIRKVVKISSMWITYCFVNDIFTTIARCKFRIYSFFKKIHVFFEATRRYRTCAGFLPTGILQFFLTTFIHARSNSAVGVKSRRRSEKQYPFVGSDRVQNESNLIGFAHPVSANLLLSESVVYTVINGTPHPHLSLNPTERDVHFIRLTVHFVSNACTNDYYTNMWIHVISINKLPKFNCLYRDKGSWFIMG